MKDKFLLCIDDMDEIGHAISTGLLAKKIAKFIGRFAPEPFVTRHQLLLDPRINYTSHNSCMCLATALTTAQRDEVVKFAKELLTRECAPSSEPGLAAAFESEIKGATGLIKFGLMAKREFLQTQVAWSEAKGRNVYLAEFKNHARGVIGALAGIGLRLSGNDGKIRGKFEVKSLNLSVAELLNLGFIEAVLDEDFKPLGVSKQVMIKGALKPIF